MKIAEIDARMFVLNLVPKEKLHQKTRVTVVINQAAYEKAINEYCADCESALKGLKPEGFDEKVNKYFLTTKDAATMTSDELKQAEELRKDAGYAEFKDTLDKVDSDYAKAQEKINEDSDYTVKERAFDDDDFVDFASALPSGEKTKFKRGDTEKEISNDALLHTLMYYFA